MSSLGSKCQFHINPIHTGANTFTKTRRVSMLERDVASTLFSFLSRLRHSSAPHRCPSFLEKFYSFSPLSEQRYEEGREDLRLKMINKISNVIVLCLLTFFLTKLMLFSPPKGCFQHFLFPRCNNNWIPSWHLGMNLQALMSHTY